MSEDSKKIAIVSPHNYPNFGTLLQAYSLAIIINELGYEPEYIDIRLNTYGKIIFLIKNPTIIFQKLCFFRRIKKSIDDDSYLNTSTFDSFRINCKKFSKENIPQVVVTKFDERKYHKVMVGSDQTWSPFLKRKGSIYFLGCIKDRKKKVSYAPSLGTINIPIDFQNYLKRALSSFSFLSCRERDNATLLSHLLGKEVSCVLDPTLLMSKDHWNDFAENMNNMPTKYILCYILGERTCISMFAEELGMVKNIPVYYILTRPYHLSKSNLLVDVCPKRFIGLIKNAEYIVTDSFHGTIISINLNKNFYSFNKRENGMDNDRIVEVLSDYSLLNRFEDGSQFHFENDIDYKNINTLIDNNRIKSIEYLKNSLF